MKHLIALFSLCLGAFAAPLEDTKEPTWYDKPVAAVASVTTPFKAAPGELYKARELTLDIAGTFTAAEPGGIDDLFTTDLDGGSWGLAVGVTTWITKYFGAGLDLGIVDIQNPSDGVIDYVGLRVVARLPLGPVAPYAMGIGGRLFDAGEYYYGCGVGIEYRLTPRAGIFTEARYLWHDRTWDTFSPQAGIRIAF